MEDLWLKEVFRGLTYGLAVPAGHGDKNSIPRATGHRCPLDPDTQWPTRRTHTGHNIEQIGPTGDSLQDTARTEGFDGRPLVCREQERGPYGLIPTNRTQQAC